MKDRARFFRVALTGNAAAGKSTVAGLLGAWGAPVIDADILARDAVAKGSAGLAAVAKRFGDAILKPDGSLDRAALRRRVMADPEERAALNAIVHPVVARLAAEAEAALEAGGAPLVVHDIPLLFEALDPALYDAVVLVDAPLAVRRARLAGRGLAPAEIDALISAQLPAEGKRGRSHFVIDNGGTLAALEARVREVWSELQRRAVIA
jgi:dephospho-CoA kinase